MHPIAETMRHDPGESRLAETGQSAQEQVLEGLAPFARRFDGQLEVLDDAALADEAIEIAGTKRDLEEVLVPFGAGVEGRGLFHRFERKLY